MAAKIKKGDKVVVLTGRDAGKSGEVLKVIPKETRAVVRGVNMVKRHQRQTAQQEGGIISKEMPIPFSNVLLICEACGAAARLGARYLDNGAKERYCKKCGAGNGQVAPPKARYAKK